MSMLITSTVTAISVSHTMIYLNTLFSRADMTMKVRGPLIVMCLSHLVQRITMTFYLDSSLSRNCTALIVIGNLFGEVLFRFCLLWMLGVLFRAMRHDDVVSKTATATSMVLFVASSIVLMEHMISAEITDETVCSQVFTQWKTTVNNLMFLGAFLVLGIPILAFLYRAVAIAKRTLNNGPSLVDTIYQRQLYFLSAFTVIYVVLLVLQWFIKQFPWLLLDFIVCDYCWLTGISMWTAGAPPGDKQTTTQNRDTDSKNTKASNSTRPRNPPIVASAQASSAALTPTQLALRQAQELA
ncbi:hypothetical protein HDU87_006887 [Geranomyces variabilis]|uniref:Uncharacterized protein n=1 Tax=Geranomyces variabilis TaxID=109894 RepID=A0AAD5TEV9_9FUNG|nr:hypothetical protein HDU87_006887 [Geranomyces variabilis]